MTTDNNHINPFDKMSGSAILANPKNVGVLLVSLCLVALIVVKAEIVGAVLLIGVMVLAVFFHMLLKKPELGIYTAIGLNFLLLGIGRYITGLPLGFGIDGVMILTFLALIFSRFRERVDWSPVYKDITVLAGVWLGYFIIQIANPEAVMIQPWIAGRGIGFYFFFFVVLTLMLINTNKRLDMIFNVWAVFSLLATLKGMGQLFFGVDYAEQAWLDSGNYLTHVLFGKLRIFSFFSDAGQFGANQGYSGVVLIIYSMAKKGWSKYFFLFVGIMGIYGMFISGTRGAIAVPFGGFMTFFVLRKNIKILSFGIFMIICIFIFFKYTMLLNGNAQIRRMRTGFDPNNKSLQVRKANQERLKGYLATRPFGGGIGHAGDKAQRFLPHAFLSNVATDSWYVMIWAEMGIVGLTLHLIILFYVMGKASYMVMFRVRDPITKIKISALIAGMAGIMAASYGNGVLGQMPTALLIYSSMAIMLNSEVYDSPPEEEKEPKLIESTT